MIYGLKVAPERLSAVGYAHYRPVGDNDTEEGRAKNRRIRMVVFKSIE
jgi:chemotaxis protein MotB